MSDGMSQAHSDASDYKEGAIQKLINNGWVKIKDNETNWLTKWKKGEQEEWFEDAVLIERIRDVEKMGEELQREGCTQYVERNRSAFLEKKLRELLDEKWNTPWGYKDASTEWAYTLLKHPKYRIRGK